MVTYERSRQWEGESRLHLQGRNNANHYIEFRQITLKEPSFDPEWIFHHPRFRRGTKAQETFPKIESSFLKSTKKVSNRVPSARVNTRGMLCDRRKREQKNSTCRYFCELLGPNLCKDCWKLAERSEAVRTHRVNSSACKLQKSQDAFSAMIASREKRVGDSESDEEILDETEDEDSVFKSPAQSRKQSSRTRSCDSGYTSRMSYVQDLCKAPSGKFCRQLTSPPTTPERTASMDEIRKKTAAKRWDVSLSQESKPIWKNKYLMTLRDRAPFKEALNSLRLPRKTRHAWRDIPVEPVLMDLKLINFTIYDGSPLNERETEQK